MFYSQAFNLIGDMMCLRTSNCRDVSKRFQPPRTGVVVVVALNRWTWRIVKALPRNYPAVNNSAWRLLGRCVSPGAARR